MFNVISTIKIPVQAFTFASSFLLLSACLHNNEDENVTPSDHYAVITTQASDYGSGNLSIISLEDYSIDNTNFESLSDTVVSTHDEYFYNINRYPDGNVTKFRINSPEVQLTQHAAQDANQPTSNPYKLVVKDENTGYLIRWGTSKIWIVNPSAANDEVYKTGEIDLSSYTGNDGAAEAVDAILIENKLYVLIQNLESYVPEIAYVAIFDTTNDNFEIETNADNNTPKGVALTITNPAKMNYLSTNNTLYIAGIGTYSKDYTNPPTPAVYAGGIESLKLADLSTKLIVDDGFADDGDTDNSPFGNISNIAILNSTRGYFVGYEEAKHTSIFSFNPTTGEVSSTPILADKDISDIEIGPLGNLWVANRSEAGITIFNTVDNTISQALISTGELLPNDIEFVSVKKAN